MFCLQHFPVRFETIQHPLIVLSFIFVIVTTFVSFFLAIHKLRLIKLLAALYNVENNFWDLQHHALPCIFDV